MREPSTEREDEIVEDLSSMNDTCQKPSCTTDATDTYSDEHGNKLDLCERHYYLLVSGKSVTTSSRSILGDRFIDHQGPPEQTADGPTTFSEQLSETTGMDVKTRRSGGTRDLHPSVGGDGDE